MGASQLPATCPRTAPERRRVPPPVPSTRWEPALDQGPGSGGIAQPEARARLCFTLQVCDQPAAQRVWPAW